MIVGSNDGRIIISNDFFRLPRILRINQHNLARALRPQDIDEMSRRNPGDDYRKGSSVYRTEDRREDDRGRDRSPLRAEERYDVDDCDQSDVKKQKLAFGFGKKTGNEQKKGIQIKLGSVSKSTVKAAPVQKPTVASVFNADDDDDEPEEMPAEARMRMRNIGRETPTSAGPNSFGKTKQGFCDSKKIFEKTLKKAMEEANK